MGCADADMSSLYTALLNMARNQHDWAEFCTLYAQQDSPSQADGSSYAFTQLCHNDDIAYPRTPPALELLRLQHITALHPKTSQTGALSFEPQSYYLRDLYVGRKNDGDLQAIFFSLHEIY